MSDYQIMKFAKRFIIGGCILIVLMLIIISIKTKVVGYLVLGFPFIIIGLIAVLFKVRTKEEDEEWKKYIEKQREDFLPNYYRKNYESAKKRVRATKGIYVGWDRMNVTHIEGLPIASGIGCEIYNREGYYEINGAGFTFRLDMDKITDMSVKDITYRTGRGAVAGTGSSATSYYMIITYVDEGMICWIRFSYKRGDNSKVKEWKTLFDYEKSLKENNSFNNENTYHI